MNGQGHGPGSHGSRGPQEALPRTALRRRRVAIEAVMGCVIVVLIVQMWLLTATLESYLAGHREPAGPAFLVSIVLTAVCGGLYVMVVRLDRSRTPEEVRPSSSGPWQI